jgi:hypothetical protein
MLPIKPAPVSLDLRARAAACEELASETVNPFVRETMLYLAMRWRTLADEDDVKAAFPHLPAGLPARSG